MNSQRKTASRSVAQILARLSKWCAYRHLFHVLRDLRKGGKRSARFKAGRNMALLGLCCPLFWIALFSGERGGTLAFHAMHSGLVCLMGIATMLTGLINHKDRS